MWLKIFFMGLACFGIEAVWHDDFGPWVNPTKGEMFPQARLKQTAEGFLILRPGSFYFVVSGNTCDIMEDAMDRYMKIIEDESRRALEAALLIPKTYVHQEIDIRGELSTLEIRMKNPCEHLPHLNMNENYTLEINGETKTGILIASHVWGILRGLESFSQLLAASPDGYLVMNCQRIVDFPRFPHRGLLLDTSRHYIPVADILLTLDAMAYNKLNVFHWHIVDDNSFPYVSTAFPELSAKGAYHPSMVYTPENVQQIIEYARLRGIRVIAEFDTPAHSKSWGQSHPELLTECWEPGQPNGKLGPMDPTKPEVMTFLETLFKEVFQNFPDAYIHLGGDEILFDCWASNPNILSYMKNHGIETLNGLEGDYMRKLLQLPKAANVSSIVWQEVFSNVADLAPDVIVHIWTGAWKGLMIDVLNKNHSAILSACWYLDHLAGGGDWVKFYMCDPLSFDGTDEMKSRVLGGEACMWSEFVDKTNMHSRIWPRASAAAERLWSDPTLTIDDATRRLEEHACRMNRRGISAQPPNGAGFCIL